MVVENFAVQCPKCFAVMHCSDWDAGHVCDPADIPDAGKPLRKGFKKSDVA